MLGRASKAGSELNIPSHQYAAVRVRPLGPNLGLKSKLTHYRQSSVRPGSYNRSRQGRAARAVCGAVGALPALAQQRPDSPTKLEYHYRLPTSEGPRP